MQQLHAESIQLLTSCCCSHLWVVDSPWEECTHVLGIDVIFCVFTPHAQLGIACVTLAAHFSPFPCGVPNKPLHLECVGTPPVVWNQKWDVAEQCPIQCAESWCNAFCSPRTWKVHPGEVVCEWGKGSCYNATPGLHLRILADILGLMSACEVTPTAVFFLKEIPQGSVQPEPVRVLWQRDMRRGWEIISQVT